MYQITSIYSNEHWTHIKINYHFVWWILIGLYMNHVYLVLGLSLFLCIEYFRCMFLHIKHGVSVSFVLWREKKSCKCISAIIYCTLQLWCNGTQFRLKKTSAQKCSPLKKTAPAESTIQWIRNTTTERTKNRFSLHVSIFDINEVFFIWPYQLCVASKWKTM